MTRIGTGTRMTRMTRIFLLPSAAILRVLEIFKHINHKIAEGNFKICVIRAIRVPKKIRVTRVIRVPKKIRVTRVIRVPKKIRVIRVIRVPKKNPCSNSAFKS